MLAAHYIQKEQINKGFPGDRLKWALAQDLDPTAKLVLVVLTDHYNVAREDTYPSAGKIAERSGFLLRRRLQGAHLRQSDSVGETDSAGQQAPGARTVRLVSQPLHLSGPVTARPVKDKKKEAWRG